MPRFEVPPLLLRSSRRTPMVASWLVLVLFVAGLAAFAVRAPGFPVHEADLDDGGIWVTNQSAGMVGRQNKPVAQLDGVFADGRPWELAEGIDVLQNGAAVVSVDRDAHTVMPVDVAMSTGVSDGRIAVLDSRVELGGDVVGLVERDTGKLWATHVDPAAGVTSLVDLSPDNQPLAEVGADATLAVSSTGTIVVASAAEGTLTTIGSSGGSFGAPQAAPLSPAPADGIAGVTVVGERAVVLDGNGVIGLPGGSASVDQLAVLQQPGPASPAVLVSTPTQLLEVALDTGSVLELAAGTGEPARPVRVQDCSFAVWADGTRGTLATSCGSAAATTVPFQLRPNAELVFRVNRGQLVLNDMQNGDVWDIDGAQPQEIADWDAFKPEEDDEQDNQEESPERSEQTQPPRAVDDDLGIRPGRTTVLHVLDNDLSSQDSILSITDVEATAQPGLEVRAAPDRQSILATVAPGTSAQALSFSYTIDQGTGDKASQDDGQVRLEVRDDASSGEPELREHFEPTVYSVAAGGSVDIPVLPDWRDPTYGDPIVLQSAQANGRGSATVTPEGQLRYAPPLRGSGPQTLRYTVTTGGAVVTEDVRVNVIDGTRTEPPKPEPDVAAGEVGAAITIRPLDNDIPGADAGAPDAHLELAGPVAPRGGLSVQTDRDSGIVTVRGQQPGVYLLDYRVTFGAANPAGARIRVDIAPPSKESNEPIAGPDTTAVLGLSPRTVDVLANDFDARGRMLVVQHAEPADGSQLEVAVLDGRWLRVAASDAAMVPRTQVVRYTISNGDATATGSLTVTQRDPLDGAENAPVAETDDVTVRAGDTVAVPVLDNDSTPSGDSVGLVVDRSVEPAGSLSVLPRIGDAYLDGRRVRYVAPAEVNGPQDLEVRYVVENTGDPTAETSVGRLRVHVVPAPDETNPNQAPTPRALEGRLVQGDVLTLRLPAVGSDPDGDSVSITGIATAPLLGRVITFGANAITYQAFPGVEGTDEFTYTVTDTYGESAIGSVRIGVVPPGVPQDPVAVNDAVTVDPGRGLSVDVLANDLRPPGMRLRIEPLVGAPEGVSLEGDTGPVLVAPSDREGTLAVPYAATSGLATSTAQLTVRYVPGWNNPPVAGDVVAHPDPDSGTVAVEPLTRVTDIDGDEADLRVDQVTGPAGGPEAVVSGGQVTLPVGDRAQVWSYRVRDADGAVAVGSIYVPARPIDTPYLKPGSRIELEPGETRTVDVSRFVVDPEGDPLVLTTQDRIIAAPQGLLEADGSGRTSIQVTAGDESGPAALTFEVSDRADLADPEAHPALITVPVQVGRSVPRISCPGEPIDVPEGGVSTVIDVRSVCHVWTEDPADAAFLEFDARFTDPVDGVDVEVIDGGLIQLTAVRAQRGDRGELAVEVRGQDAAGRLFVRVVELGPPSLATVPPLETRAGTPVTVDLASYLDTQVPAASRDVVVTAVDPLAGATARVTIDGSRVTLSPAAGTHGVMRYRVEVSDFGPDGDRPRAVGMLSVAVTDKPGVPSGLAVGAEFLSNVVNLTWKAPENNGARIGQYEVDVSGSTRTCPGSPCRIDGLENGTDYRFRVRAVNDVGAGDWSTPVSAEPDAFTGPVQALTVIQQRDRQVTLSWQPPAPCDCSDVRYYRVSWPGGGNQQVSANRRTFPAAVTTNGEDVTFTVVPFNDKGVAENTGPPRTITGQGAGEPDAPVAPSLVGTNRPGNDQKGVEISWGPVGPNGPGPTQYTVSRTGGGAPKEVCTWVTETSCRDDVSNDGTTYSYTVTAKNQEADEARESSPTLHISAPSAGSTMEAAAPPDAVTITELTPTGRDGEAQLAFDAGASHGRTNVVHCEVNGRGCGEWSFAAGGGHQSGVISGLPNGSTSTVRLWACNGSSGSAQTGAACSGDTTQSTVTYGPIGQVSLDASADGTRTRWSFSVDPNGRSVHVRLTLNGSTIREFDSGVGTFSDSGSDELGYSRTGTYRLVVSDSGRNGATVERSARTEDEPPRPPDPQVYVGRGTPCGGGGGAACRGGSCSSSSCAYVHVTTEGFSSSVTCNFDSWDGAQGWLQGRSWGANESKDSPNWYGYPGTWVRVSCGGVTTQINW